MTRPPLVKPERPAFPEPTERQARAVPQGRLAEVLAAPASADPAEAPEADPFSSPVVAAVALQVVEVAEVAVADEAELRLEGGRKVRRALPRCGACSA